MFVGVVVASDPRMGTFLALSQNLGHEKLDVTLGSYARPDDQARARLIARLDSQPNLDGAFDLDALVRELIRLDPGQAAKIIAEYMKLQK